MKHSLTSLTVVFTTLATIQPALAFGPAERQPLPDFDRRSAGTNQAPSTEQTAALASLRRQVPNLDVAFEPVVGAPKSIASTTEFLTGLDGQGKTVSPGALAAISPGDPCRVVKGFLAQNQDLFGHGPEVLDRALTNRDYVTEHNGVRTIVLQQQSGGIRIFDAVLVAHTTRRGELINLSSQFLPNPDRAAARGTPNLSALLAAPAISSAKAVVLAAQDVGVSFAEDELRPEGETEASPEAHQKFRAPGLKGPAEARLLWLPMERESLRLCWDVIVMSRERGEMFRTFVDVNTGELLRRQCLTRYLSDASYRVWTSDSPSPFSPGWSTPNSGQAPLVARTLVTWSALDTNASPAGWINDGDNQTLGNNVDAHTDRNADNLPDLPGPRARPSACSISPWILLRRTQPTIAAPPSSSCSTCAIGFTTGFTS